MGHDVLLSLHADLIQTLPVSTHDKEMRVPLQNEFVLPALLSPLEEVFADPGRIMRRHHLRIHRRATSMMYQFQIPL